MPVYEHPRLLVDVEGVDARFALEIGPDELEQRRHLRCADYADLFTAVVAYLESLPSRTEIRHAAVAIANPVEGDQVRMTNYPWTFSIDQTRERLGLETLVVVNDFTALAMAMPRLREDERRAIGRGTPREGSVIGVIGAGTGLGVSALVPSEEGWTSLGSEGGHASFSPNDEREMAILEFARRQYAHVSVERLLSTAGLELVHRALAARSAATGTPQRGAAEITRLALAGTDSLCVETLEAFCNVLGTAASNLALTLGAHGGVYIGGTIVPRLGTFFDRSGFRLRFESKGRLHDYLAAIPTYVITADDATFLGVSAILDAHLRRLGKGSGLLDRMRRVRNELPPAERRVADRVLEHPRQVLGEPIADIAKAAEVSQPTVIRFCRSLGCNGLSDFKLRLASSLGGTVPVTHSHVTYEDSALELGAKVMDNTASAILQVRDNLNRQALDRAIDLLARGRHIEFYAIGHYGMVAQDAQFKFLRLGLSSAAYTDPRLQRLAAAVLTKDDAMVVISASGRAPELLDAADRALARGAAVVAITASQSPLARKATVSLLVDHPEDAANQMVMISRILYLLTIDILAVGVAMRRGTHAAALSEQPDGESAPPPKLEMPLSADGREHAEAAAAAAVAPLSSLTAHGR